MKPSPNHRRKSSGFTLIELLVVLGILVLLVALVTPRILGTQKKADINLTKVQIGSFKGALEKYAFDMKAFPTTDEGLAALVTEPLGEEGTSTGRWDGPYIDFDELPKDPWGNDYHYAYDPETSTRTFPDIWSNGPDGVDGTDDDICNWKTEDTEGEEGAEKDYFRDDFDREPEPEF